MNIKEAPVFTQRAILDPGQEIVLTKDTYIYRRQKPDKLTNAKIKRGMKYFIVKPEKNGLVGIAKNPDDKAKWFIKTDAIRKIGESALQITREELIEMITKECGDPKMAAGVVECMMKRGNKYKGENAFQAAIECGMKDYGKMSEQPKTKMVKVKKVRREDVPVDVKTKKVKTLGAAKAESAHPKKKVVRRKAV